MRAQRISGQLAVLAVVLVGVGCMSRSDVPALCDAVKTSTPEELRAWAAQVSPRYGTNMTPLLQSDRPAFFSRAALTHRAWCVVAGPDGLVQLISPGGFEGIGLVIGSEAYRETSRERSSSYMIYDGIYVRDYRM
jgi:hypothetical protein